MNRILKPVTYVLAVAYFLVDAVFIAVAKPVSDWLAKHLVLRKLRSWIRSLRPYPSLALFSVPVIILEPVKPVAAYLAATGQIVSSVLTLIVGELFACANRAFIQSHPRQIDEDSGIRLGIHQVPTSQGLVRSHRSLASHTDAGQGRSQLHRADEAIWYCVVWPVLG